MSATAPPTAQTLRRLINHLRPWRVWVVLIVIVDLLAVPLALLAPLPLKIAVDNAIGGQPLPAWLLPWIPAGLSSDGLGSMLALAVALVVLLAMVSQVQSSGA